MHAYKKLEDSRISEKENYQINTYEYFQSIFCDTISFIKNVLRIFSGFPHAVECENHTVLLENVFLGLYY